jgi:hypothetical protein
VSFKYADVTTDTDAPASAAVAVFVHARPRTPLPSRDSSCVHPAGPVTVPLVLLPTKNNTNASPARTAAGTTTE